jgi:hypothetical protein
MTNLICYGKQDINDCKTNIYNISDNNLENTKANAFKVYLI